MDNRCECPQHPGLVWPFDASVEREQSTRIKVGRQKPSHERATKAQGLAGNKNL